MRNVLAGLVLTASVFAASASAAPVIRITEWMYNNDEFVEITNVGDLPQSFEGWSFDDSSRTAGSFSLSSIGTLAPGASALITEQTAEVFRARWSIPATVSIVGSNGQNLGRSDEINIYDASANLIDRLTYADQNGLGPRTQDVSGNLPLAALGLNNPNAAVLSVAGDLFGSIAVPALDNPALPTATANPGVYTPFVVPEPALLGGLPLFGLLLGRRRK